MGGLSIRPSHDRNGGTVASREVPLESIYLRMLSAPVSRFRPSRLFGMLWVQCVSSRIHSTGRGFTRGLNYCARLILEAHRERQNGELTFANCEFGC